MVGVFGTMCADVLHVGLGVPYIASTIFYAVVLAVIFRTWHRTEGTLSIHSIYTARREAFSWATVLATFALGTAAGDLTAVTFGLGYFASGLLFTAVIAVPAIGYWALRLERGVLGFWFAYVVTRPLGASFADWLAVSNERGGLGLGTGPVSLVLAALIACFVAYLSFTRKDVPGRRAATSVSGTGESALEQTEGRLYRSGVSIDPLKRAGRSGRARRRARGGAPPSPPSAPAGPGASRQARWRGPVGVRRSSATPGQSARRPDRRGAGAAGDRGRALGGAFAHPRDGLAPCSALRARTRRAPGGARRAARRAGRAGRRSRAGLGRRAAARLPPDAQGGRGAVRGELHPGDADPVPTRPSRAPVPLSSREDDRDRRRARVRRRDRHDGPGGRPLRPQPASGPPAGWVGTTWARACAAPRSPMSRPTSPCAGGR